MINVGLTAKSLPKLFLFARQYFNLIPRTTHKKPQSGYSFWHPMEDLIPNWKDFGISQLRSDPNMQYLNAEHSTYV
ncbi:hypothetical protein P8452_36186 [Trifolium repens]|nr:hypothetical protein P8452_36186 [Trifolium repens]